MSSTSLDQRNVSTLRVSRDCIPNLWITNTENGTEWHGYYHYVLKELAKILPAKIEFVHEKVSNSTFFRQGIYSTYWQLRMRSTVFWTWERWFFINLSGLHGGTADIDPDYYSLDHASYSFIDYSPPISIGDVHIISVKKAANTGKIFEGIFDTTSYACIISSYIMFAFIMWHLKFR